VEGQESVVTDYILNVSKRQYNKKKREMDIVCPNKHFHFLCTDPGSGDLCRYNGWGLHDQRYLRRTKEACHNWYVQSAIKERSPLEPLGKKI
jgi:hypothetical protein